MTVQSSCDDMVRRCCAV